MEDEDQGKEMGRKREKIERKREKNRKDGWEREGRKI